MVHGCQRRKCLPVDKQPWQGPTEAIWRLFKELQNVPCCCTSKFEWVKGEKTISIKNVNLNTVYNFDNNIDLCERR